VKLIFIQSSNYGGVYVALSDAAYLVVDEVDEIYFEKIGSGEWKKALNEFRNVMRQKNWNR